MITKPIKTRLFIEKESLSDFIFEHIPQFCEKDILVVASKIIALSQGRTSKEKSMKEKFIEYDSDVTIETPWCTMGLTNGRWTANAGIDESNAGDKLILFPSNLEEEIKILRNRIMDRYNLKKFAVIITDSRTTPLRSGVTASTVASAGIKPMRSYIDKPDLFKKLIKFTQLNVVDSISASAGLEMGEGNENVPLILIKEAPVEFTNELTPAKLLNIPARDDLYYEVFKSQVD